MIDGDYIDDDLLCSFEQIYCIIILIITMCVILFIGLTCTMQVSVQGLSRVECESVKSLPLFG